ncbi:MAG: hypothetical protein FK733_18945 [Asgard group archaeon]|nr:hypothetical protein [Asgard group archaeon]
MSEKLIKELEDFLIPYALDRYDVSNSPLGGIAKTFMRRMIETGENYVVWIARALVRCIVSVEKEMYLKDIVSVVLSEGYVMMGFTPMRHPGTTEIEDLAGQKVLAEHELHNWLIHLQEAEKLPGRYNRFIGLYVSRPL